MTIYVALLRGINVGGHNKIKMADLRVSLELLGLKQVKTYIQSGNILFQSDESESALQERLQSRVEKDFGIVSTVVIRTAEEMKQIISNNPFSEQEISKASSSAKGECMYVAMLPIAPSAKNSDTFLSYTNDQEQCVITGRDVYFLFHDSIRNSKLNNNLKKLEVPATVRNWKTLTKLSRMMEDLISS
ncbi:DUF1697 domain-containing protein [Aquibacillus koreensis]|uniref:DUF1697 domain-containing protein n=1 Tax=Aquibacillus koreensis TaxID=279446 RepID=A0A9X3WR92_9BACI|nr:DUF1697 domain-containing protein [Aquibacillus koreensis]MCT2535401.1 DUF1697 domain-containing protein [Aquibacillus koreensis]MDC3422236.1 DUF1697 domain-containing protein [Aquibacillus koreensis]